MNLNLSMREKVLLVAVALVAIIAIGTRFLIIPTSKELRDNSENLLKTQLKYSMALQEQAEAKTISGNLKKAFNKAKSAADAFLPPVNKPALNVWLAGIADKSGLTISSILISDPVAANPGVSSTVNNSSSGSSNQKTVGGIEYNMKKYADIIKGVKTSSGSVNTTSQATTSSSSSATSSSSKSNSSTVSGDAEMVSVNMEMTGKYDSAKNFIDAIKNTKRYIVIKSFNFLNDSGTFKFQITLECYGSEKLTDDDIYNWLLPSPQGRQNLM